MYLLLQYNLKCIRKSESWRDLGDDPLAQRAFEYSASPVRIRNVRNRRVYRTRVAVSNQTQNRQIKMDQNLILLPAKQLLEKFGAGSHVPGSGSAAAFSGILACKLSVAVIKLTKQKEDYADTLPQMNFIEEQITELLEPSLFRAFQKDSDEFDRVITARLERNRAKNPKKRKQLSEQARALLKSATEIPIEICGTCHLVCQHALSLFDLGFKSARGDSGAAASLALSGAHAALFVCYLNLKEFRDGEWAIRTRKNCDELLQQSRIMQINLFSRVTRLQEEGIKPSAIQLEFKLE